MTLATVRHAFELDEVVDYGVLPNDSAIPTLFPSLTESIGKPLVMRLMDETMKPPLRPKQIAYLLEELCVELGFCLPPDEHARLQNWPPDDIDAFTDEVFRAEGVDPLANRQLRHQGRARVAKCFERMGAGAA